MVTVSEVINSLEKEKKDSAKAYYKKLKKTKEIEINSIIDKDQNHLILVNLVAYPFQMESKLADSGYRFVCVDPLIYFGEKNFDVFLYNDKTKEAILLECKAGSFVEQTIASEVNDKIKISSEKKNHLEEICGKISKMEFVLAIPAIAKDKVVSLIKESEISDKTCVWSTDFFIGIIQLVYGKHVSNELNSKLSEVVGLKCADFNRNIDFLPSSHPALIMENVTIFLASKLKASGKKVFTKTDMCELLRGKFLNYPENEIVRLAESYIKMGIENDIFVSLEDHENRYALDVGKKFGREGEEAKNKCIKNSIEKAASKEFLKNYEAEVTQLKSKIGTQKDSKMRDLKFFDK